MQVMFASRPCGGLLAGLDNGGRFRMNFIVTSGRRLVSLSLKGTTLKNKLAEGQSLKTARVLASDGTAAGARGPSSEGSARV